MLTQIAITGQWQGIGGWARHGTVTFTLSHILTDTSNGHTVSTNPIVAVLDQNGSMPAGFTLTATDDTTTTPIGATYTVIERFDDETTRAYSLAIPHTSPGGTLSLNEVTYGDYPSGATP